MSALRVGVVGCGGIAQMMHLPTLAERPDLFRILALADVSRSTLDLVNMRYAAPFTTTDFRDLLDKPEIDAVLLLTSGSHRQAAIAALGAGKHVFVEKPLGYGRSEIEEVGRAAKTGKNVLMIGYHKRFDPAYLRAREAVRALGGLRYVEVSVLHPDDGDYRSHHAIFPLASGERAVSEEMIERATREKATEGPVAPLIDAMVGIDAPLEDRVGALILTESLIHDVNAIRGVLGEPEEVISAHVWRNGLAQTSVTRFPGDVRVVMSWISVTGLRHYEERLRFVAPEGRVTLAFPSPYLRHLPTPLSIERMERGELVVEERAVSYEEAFRAELHAFRRSIVEGAPVVTPWEDALGDARWIEAIARAFRS